MENDTWELDTPQEFFDTERKRRVRTAIQRERAHQAEKYGPLEEHHHNPFGWTLILESLADDAREAWVGPPTGTGIARNEIVQIAATASAMLEQNEGHNICDERFIDANGAIMYAFMGGELLGIGPPDFEPCRPLSSRLVGMETLVRWISQDLPSPEAGKSFSKNPREWNGQTRRDLRSDVQALLRVSFEALYWWGPVSRGHRSLIYRMSGQSVKPEDWYRDEHVYFDAAKAFLVNRFPVPSWILNESFPAGTREHTVESIFREAFEDGKPVRKAAQLACEAIRHHGYALP